MSARRSVIEGIIHKPPPETPEEQDVRDAFQGERQARVHPPMLTVIFKNGDERLLAYPLLRDAFKRKGGSEWELVFDDWRVIFTGRNLGDKLRDLLRMHRLSFLQEGNLVEDDLTPEDHAFIESIQIKPKE